MMLFIDGINQGVKRENVGYWIQSYESAFELLNQLVADNWILEFALIVDNGDTMVIPVEAFDGQPIQAHIQALQQQWTQLLQAKPNLSFQARISQPKDWCSRLDTYYDNLLTHLEKMIFLLETSKQQLFIKRSHEVRVILGHQYEVLLEGNRTLYQQTKKNRQRNEERLKELENG